MTKLETVVKGRWPVVIGGICNEAGAGSLAGLESFGAGLVAAGPRKVFVSIPRQGRTTRVMTEMVRAVWSELEAAGCMPFELTRWSGARPLSKGVSVVVPMAVSSMQVAAKRASLRFAAEVAAAVGVTGFAPFFDTIRCETVLDGVEVEDLAELCSDGSGRETVPVGLLGSDGSGVPFRAEINCTNVSSTIRLGVDPVEWPGLQDRVRDLAVGCEEVRLAFWESGRDWFMWNGWGGSVEGAARVPATIRPLALTKIPVGAVVLVDRRPEDVRAQMVVVPPMERPPTPAHQTADAVLLTQVLILLEARAAAAAELVTALREHWPRPLVTASWISVILREAHDREFAACRGSGASAEWELTETGRHYLATRPHHGLGERLLFDPSHD